MKTKVCSEVDRLDDLLRRYRASRQPDVLGEAFDVAAPALFRLALVWTADAATAEDALQETFLAAFVRIDAWDPDRPAAPWLAGILRHKCAKLRRRARRDPQPLTVPLPDLGEGPPDSAQRREETERVRAALARLPEPYRSVGLLRWRHGLTPAEIAEVRGEPPGTVRSTLTRALQRLRRELGSLACLAIGWWRSPRGLRAVRAQVVRAANGAQTGSVVLTLPVAAFIAGGLLMVAKKQVVAAVAFAALLLAVTAGRTCSTSRESRPPTSTESVARAISGARAAAPHVGTRAPAQEPEAPPPPPQGPVLRGVVLDRSQSPVPGARVSAFPASVATAVAPETLGAVTTGIDGRFVLGGLIADSLYVVVAQAHGFAPRTRTGVRPPGDMTIVLGSPASFEGRVLGSDDAPVAGARVRVFGVLAGGAKFDATSTSGEDGSYRVRGLPPIERRHTSPDGQLAIEARAEGLAPLLVADVLDVGPQAVPDLAEGRATRFDLHMIPGAVVTGRAFDESGRPVEGARVALMSYERPPALDRFVELPHALGTTTTAADGTFRFAAVPAAGVHRPAILGEILPFGAVVAVGPEGRTGVVTIPVLRDGESHAVELMLAPVAWVTGRVVDETGAPVAGAAVSARTANGRPMRATFRSVPGMDVPCPFTTSAADGRFRAAVPLTPDAGTRLLVGAASAAAGMQPYRSAENAVTIDPAGTTDAGDVVLRAEPTGVHADVAVVDAAGRPVAGAAFRSRDELHIGGFAWGWPATDAEGRSRLQWRRRAKDDVPAAAVTREVVVTSPGSAAAVADVVFDSAARDPQRIELSPGLRVAGRVRWSDGRPAADAWVLVADAAVPLDEAIPNANSGRGSPERHPAVRGLVLLGMVHTEADGSFRVEDLPDRAFHVVARVESFDGPGGRLTETSRAALRDIRPGAEDLALVLPPRAGTDAQQAVKLDVRILDDATGRALAGAKAELFDGTTTILYGVTVGDGLVRFDAAPQGVWTLLASSPRFGRTIVVGVRIGDASTGPLEVRVARGATVHGRIGDVGGAGIVRLAPEDASIPWFWQPYAIVTKDGTFTLEGVAAGRYRVLVSATANPAQAVRCGDLLEVRSGDADVQFESRAIRDAAGR